MNSIIEGKISRFCDGYKVLSYKKGDIVIRGDDEPTGVYFIRGGMVKMSYVDEEGSDLTVNIYKNGTFFPMTWAIADIGNNYNYQVIADAKLVRVPKSEFLEFLETNPEVLFDLTKRILIGLDGLIFNMSHLLSGKSDAKVAAVIHMLAARFGVQKNSQTEIAIALSHNDLSRFAGITRETTTLAINRLIKKDIIIQKRRRLYVKDMAALRSAF